MKHEVLSGETVVLSGEPVLRRIGPRVFRENECFFEHLNSMLGSSVIVIFLLTAKRST